METPSKNDNDSDSHKSEENNTQSEEPSDESKPQTSEVTEKEESQINSTTESNVEENNVSPSSGGVIIVRDTITEEAVTNEPTKEINTDLTKCPEEFANTIAKLSAIEAYPFKNKPKQPFRHGVGTSPSSVPRPAHDPPVVPRPPAPSRGPVPLRRIEQNESESGASHPPVTEQPRRAPGVRFVDPFPHMDTGVMIPMAMFNTVIWAQLPPKIPANIPTGLGCLVTADNIYVTQISYYDYFGYGCDFFVVQNRNGECLYFVYESSNVGEFALCDSCRAYRLHVLDMFNAEAIIMDKLSGSNACVCCYPEMQVFISPGVPVGAVTRKYNCTHEVFSIRDPDQNEMFRMSGNACVACFFHCCPLISSTYTIRALDPDRTEVGLIQRNYGYAVGGFYDTGIYGLTMPMDMDVRTKALFLGALFLVGF